MNNIKRIIKYYENVALSNKDLEEIVDNKAKIVLYPNLIKYETINEVLGKTGACFLLFEAKPSYGHWCCLFKQNKNTIEFFNPYGGFPDNSLDYIPLHFRKITNQLYPILSILLIQSPYNLTYNEYAFQRKSKDIKTCGYHCAVRLLLRNLTLKEYKKYLDKMSKELGLDYDGVVTYILRM
jgi:hypothetical protein